MAPTKNRGLISGDPEGWALPAPHCIINKTMTVRM